MLLSTCLFFIILKLIYYYCLIINKIITFLKLFSEQQKGEITLKVLNFLDMFLIQSREKGVEDTEAAVYLINK